MKFQKVSYNAYNTFIKFLYGKCSNNFVNDYIRTYAKPMKTFHVCELYSKTTQLRIIYFHWNSRFFLRNTIIAGTWYEKYILTAINYWINQRGKTKDADKKWVKQRESGFCSFSIYSLPIRLRNIVLSLEFYYALSVLYFRNNQWNAFFERDKEVEQAPM